MKICVCLKKINAGCDESKFIYVKYEKNGKIIKQHNTVTLYNFFLIDQENKPLQSHNKL